MINPPRHNLSGHLITSPHLHNHFTSKDRTMDLLQHALQEVFFDLLMGYQHTATTVDDPSNTTYTVYLPSKGLPKPERGTVSSCASPNRFLRSLTDGTQPRLAAILQHSLYTTWPVHQTNTNNAERDPFH